MKLELGEDGIRTKGHREGRGFDETTNKIVGITSGGIIMMKQGL